VPPAADCPCDGRLHHNDLQKEVIVATKRSVTPRRKTSPAPAAAHPGDSRPSPSLEQFLRAVDDQRSKLLNVLGTLQCMEIAVQERPPRELQGAVLLLEDEVQRVIEALDVNVLPRAAAEVQP
jgi:hypothetical protein